MGGRRRDRTGLEPDAAVLPGDSPADDEASTRQEAADGSDDDQIWWINQRIVVMRRLTQNLFNRCERRDVTDDEDANRRRARAFRIQHRWQSQSRHGEE